jgi:pimeloyl-ACP methyl ester carboxylesterase
MERYVEIKRPQGILRGMIHSPDSGSGPFPVLVMFHGFQSNRMESNSLFVALSRTLAEHGYASVRFDFTGSGESEGTFLDVTVSSLLEDALSIVEWTAGRTEIDPERIGLCGHSMGGSIAGMLAARIERDGVGDRNARIRTLVLLAPAGEIKDRINEEIARRGLDMTIDSPGFDAIPFPVQFGTERFSKEFFTDLRLHDVMKETSSYRGQVVLVQGDEDHAVPHDVALLYEKSLISCALRIVKGAGHKFNTYASRAELFEIIVEHLVRRL